MSPIEVKNNGNLSMHWSITAGGAIVVALASALIAVGSAADRVDYIEESARDSALRVRGLEVRQATVVSELSALREEQHNQSIKLDQILKEVRR